MPIITIDGNRFNIDSMTLKNSAMQLNGWGRRFTLYDENTNQSHSLKFNEILKGISEVSNDISAEEKTELWKRLKKMENRGYGTKVFPGDWRDLNFWQKFVLSFRRAWGQPERHSIYESMVRDGWGTLKQEESPKQEDNPANSQEEKSSSSSDSSSSSSSSSSSFANSLTPKETPNPLTSHEASKSSSSSDSEKFSFSSTSKEEPAPSTNKETIHLAEGTLEKVGAIVTLPLSLEKATWQKCKNEFNISEEEFDATFEVIKPLFYEVVDYEILRIFVDCDVEIQIPKNIDILYDLMSQVLKLSFEMRSVILPQIQQSQWVACLTLHKMFATSMENLQKVEAYLVEKCSSDSLSLVLKSSAQLFCGKNDLENMTNLVEIFAKRMEFSSKEESEELAQRFQMICHVTENYGKQNSLLTSAKVVMVRHLWRLPKARLVLTLSLLCDYKYEPWMVALPGNREINPLVIPYSKNDKHHAVVAVVDGFVNLLMMASPSLKNDPTLSSRQLTLLPPFSHLPIDLVKEIVACNLHLTKKEANMNHYKKACIESAKKIFHYQYEDTVFHRVIPDEEWLEVFESCSGIFDEGQGWKTLEHDKVLATVIASIPENRKSLMYLLQAIHKQSGGVPLRAVRKANKLSCFGIKRIKEFVDHREFQILLNKLPILYEDNEVYFDRVLNLVEVGLRCSGRMSKHSSDEVIKRIVLLLNHVNTEYDQFAFFEKLEKILNAPLSWEHFEKLILYSTRFSGKQPYHALLFIIKFIEENKEQNIGEIFQFYEEFVSGKFKNSHVELDHPFDFFKALLEVEQEEQKESVIKIIMLALDGSKRPILTDKSISAAHDLIKKFREEAISVEILRINPICASNMCCINKLWTVGDILEKPELQARVDLFKSLTQRKLLDFNLRWQEDLEDDIRDLLGLSTDEDSSS